MSQETAEPCTLCNGMYASACTPASCAPDTSSRHATRRPSAARLPPSMAAPPPPGAGAARFSGHTIKLFADSLGLGALPDDVAAAQAAEVEYRLRQVIQARMYRLHVPVQHTVV